MSSDLIDSISALMFRAVQQSMTSCVSAMPPIIEPARLFRPKPCAIRAFWLAPTALTSGGRDTIVLARLVTAHCDDPLGAHLFRGEDNTRDHERGAEGRQRDPRLTPPALRREAVRTW
jgi:hypothetical protein